MAGTIYSANTTSEAALTASSEYCAIWLKAPTSNGIKLKEWGVYFDGISAVASPVVVRLCACDSSFAGASVTVVPTKRAGHQILSQTVAVRQVATTGEPPSIFGVYAAREVHPQSGYQEKFAYGDEIVICGSATTAGGAIGILVNSPTTVNVLAEMVFEE
jgi:hypothetical protein